MAGLVSTEVLGGLENFPYGVWYYNRREVVKTLNGKRVRKGPRSEWIAVPIPNAGVPLQTVLAARKAVENNEKYTNAGRREWQLSGGIARCGECGCALIALTSHYNYTKKDGEKVKHSGPTTVVQPIGGSEEWAARCTAPSTPCERKRWYGGP